MQVSDLTFRLKLYTLGLLTPIFIILGLLFSAPYFLTSNETYSVSEFAVLESTNPLPSKKTLRGAYALYQKKAFQKLILVIREDKTDNLILPVKEREEKIKSYLISQGLPDEAILSLKIPPVKSSESEDIAKHLLKLVISENTKSVLVLAKQYEATRVLKTYRKVFQSIPTKVYVYSTPSENTSSNWFLTEAGVTEVILELSKYINSYIRGIL
ncbi:MAG: hypothetical protein MUF77_09355 [Leptospira sp.]|jgi:hypothetical protein|nr:hypothetical protein [Leptospira sp.]